MQTKAEKEYVDLCNKINNNLANMSYAEMIQAIAQIWLLRQQIIEANSYSN